MVSEEDVILHIEAHLANIDDAIETLHPKKRKSKREVAELRFQVYILVLTRSAIRGLVALLRAREYRSAIVLGRCLFEYRIKSEYLLKNRKEAYRQFSLIPRRIHADLIRLPSPDDVTAAEITNSYLSWRRTAGKLADDYMGDIGVSRMALSIAEDRQIDQDEREYSKEFIHKYGIPSWTVHADAVGIVEIFPGWDRDDNWTIADQAFEREQFSSVTQQTLHTVFDHLRAIRIHYKLDFEPLAQLALRSVEIRESERAKWGR